MTFEPSNFEVSNLRVRLFSWRERLGTAQLGMKTPIFRIEWPNVYILSASLYIFYAFSDVPGRRGAWTIQNILEFVFFFVRVLNNNIR